MKIEEQVSSLELSKELRKLGVKQDGLYSYFQYDEWNVMLRGASEIFSPNNECGYNKDNLICSAFTVAELGEMLPYYAQSHKEDARSGRWCCDVGTKQCFADTEADARARMLICLIENKLL